MNQLLLVIQILVAVGLIALVLLQQGRGADAGAAFGGGGAGTVFGSRGPATLLTRLTAIFAAVFFVNSIGLAYFARERSLETGSVMERVETGARTEIPVELPPADTPSESTGASEVPLPPEDSQSGTSAGESVPIDQN